MDEKNAKGEVLVSREKDRKPNFPVINQVFAAILSLFGMIVFIREIF